jgi:hypothetical protein
MDGGHLHEYVWAIAFVFHHLLDAADLAFNAAEPQQQILAGLRLARHGAVRFFVSVFLRPSHTIQVYPWGVYVVKPQRTVWAILDCPQSFRPELHARPILILRGNR